MTWTRKGKAPMAEEWDADIVVSHFLEAEKTEGQLSGEWDRYVPLRNSSPKQLLTISREVIRLRVDDLDRSKDNKSVTHSEGLDNATEKAKTQSLIADTAASIGTAWKMLGFLIPKITSDPEADTWPKRCFRPVEVRGAAVEGTQEAHLSVPSTRSMRQIGKPVRSLLPSAGSGPHSIPPKLFELQTKRTSRRSLHRQACPTLIWGEV